ncbi:MAG: amidohydrolase [Acidobacteria bacterium]|nr:amidohydrolase [Acidobacteriota bacterium]
MERITAAGLLLMLFAGISAPAQAPADLVLTNGVFMTLDEERPMVRALAVRDGRILSLGSPEEMKALTGPHTRVVDLAGAVAYPGFIDAHAHVRGLGASMGVLDLTTATSEEDAAARVARAAASAKPGEWVLGRGWDQNRWPGKAFPGRRSLSRAAPRNPVLLRRVDGHAGWVNDAALRVAGIGRKPPEVRGGEVLVDAEGRPTGILVDNAMDLVGRHVPPATPEKIRQDLEKALKECARLGITEVHDAGVGPSELDAYRRLLREGRLKVRIWAMLEGPEPWLEKELGGGPREEDPEGMLTLGGVKFYADGALGSRGAWLLAPYADRPDASGFPLTPPDELARLASLCARWRVQACTHAIGDRAVRETLDAYARALAGQPDGRGRRFRVEHAQVVDPADVPRFAALGVIPSMQPTHCTSDMPWAPERLGPVRTLYAYAWKSFLATGARIAAGTDFPIELPNPVHTFYAAVTRKARDQGPPDGWTPGQRLTRMEALLAMTRWAAEAAFQEERLGRLAPGFRADLTVCDLDLLSLPEEKIPDVRVLWTVVNGKIVYAAK